jgi:hypothetical protein
MPVSKEWLVSQHLRVSCSHTHDDIRVAEAEICALSEIVQAMLLRMPDHDLRAVAQAIGFRAVEEE